MGTFISSFNSLYHFHSIFLFVSFSVSFSSVHLNFFSLFLTVFPSLMWLDDLHVCHITRKCFFSSAMFQITNIHVLQILYAEYMIPSTWEQQTNLRKNASTDFSLWLSNCYAWHLHVYSSPPPIHTYTEAYSKAHIHIYRHTQRCKKRKLGGILILINDQDEKVLSEIIFSVYCLKLNK